MGRLGGRGWVREGVGVGGGGCGCGRGMCPIRQLRHKLTLVCPKAAILI